MCCCSSSTPSIKNVAISPSFCPAIILSFLLSCSLISLLSSLFSLLSYLSLVLFFFTIFFYSSTAASIPPLLLLFFIPLSLSNCTRILTTLHPLYVLSHPILGAYLNQHDQQFAPQMVYFCGPLIAAIKMRQARVREKESAKGEKESAKG